MESEAGKEEIKIVHAHIKTVWDGGIKTTNLARGFEIVMDGPKWKYGTNSAPAPGEMFLASISACFTSTFTKCVQENMVILDDVVTDIRGTIDHEMDGKERIMRIDIELKAYADERFREILQKCFEESKVRCPLINAVQCEINITYKYSNK